MRLSLCSLLAVTIFARYATASAVELRLRPLARNLALRGGAQPPRRDGITRGDVVHGVTTWGPIALPGLLALKELKNEFYELVTITASRCWSCPR